MSGDPRTPTSDPVAEPQTEAGRTLLATLRSFLDMAEGHPAWLSVAAPRVVAAIEAEARQQARAAFAAQVDEHVVPWWRVPGDDALEQGVMRRCLLCGRTSKIVPEPTVATVTHEPDCGVLALLAASPEPASPGSDGPLRFAVKAFLAARSTRQGSHEMLVRIQDMSDALAARPDGANSMDPYCGCGGEGHDGPCLGKGAE